MTVGRWTLREARDVIRHCDPYSLGREDVSHLLGVDLAAADEFCAAMVEAGYMAPRPDADGGFCLTAEGGRLRLASARLPTSKAKAHDTLVEMLDRVEQLNSEQGWVYQVDAVDLFGSMLDRSAGTVNDVDLIVTTSFAYDEDAVHAAIVNFISDAQRGGRVFPNIFARAAWPYTAFLRALRGRSSVLSLHHEKDPVADLVSKVRLFDRCPVSGRPGRMSAADLRELIGL